MDWIASARREKSMDGSELKVGLDVRLIGIVVRGKSIEGNLQFGAMCGFSDISLTDGLFKLIEYIILYYWKTTLLN